MWKKLTSIFSTKTKREEISQEVSATASAGTLLPNSVVETPFVIDNKWLPKNKVSLEEALYLIVNNIGFNTLANPNLDSFINDITDFDGVYMYKSVFKGLVQKNIFAEMVANFNNSAPIDAICNKALYKATKHYGFADEPSRYIINLMQKIILSNFKIKPPITKSDYTSCSPKLDNQNQEQTSTSSTSANISSLLFLGVPLGSTLQIFEQEILKKGYKKKGIRRKNGEHAQQYRGKFAGLEDCMLALYYSTITNIVYKAEVMKTTTMVGYSATHKTLKELYLAKYGNIQEKQVYAQLGGIEKIATVKISNDTRIELATGSVWGNRIQYICDSLEQIVLPEIQRILLNQKNRKEENQRKKFQKDIADI